MGVTNKGSVERIDVAGKPNAGVMLEGSIGLWELVRGDRIQLVELQFEEGFKHPHHNHPEHESIGYVISGKLQMKIDGTQYIVGAGDAWHLRAGVYHESVALENTHAVEVHSPPRPEYRISERT
jgi:quercetin dioxygenase-like cupin family protein